MYIPKVKAARYVNQIFTELNGERNSNVIITDNFNMPLLVTDRPLREKKPIRKLRISIKLQT